jgi:serine phosphatase RsbU (regulator of sigma subunit)
MTLFSLSIDLNTRKMKYINSGHMPQLFISPQDKKPKLLLRTKTSSLLGFGKKVEPEELQSIDLHGEETICLYSDGLFERETSMGGKFSLKTFSKFFKDTEGESAETIRARIADALRLHSAGELSAIDDITFLVIKLKKSGIQTKAS